MNLIPINSLAKRRIKDMIVHLLPEYRYCRVTNRGLVVLKTSKWSFKRTVVNVTDLCIDILPRKLSEYCRKKGKGTEYEELFNQHIYLIMQLKAYKKEFDILSYIWEQFNKLHREIPVITIQSERVILDNPAGKYIPSLSAVSRRYIPGIEELIRRIYNKDTVYSIVKKISKIQKKHSLSLPRFIEYNLRVAA